MHVSEEGHGDMASTRSARWSHMGRMRSRPSAPSGRRGLGAHSSRAPAVSVASGIGSGRPSRHGRVHVGVSLLVPGPVQQHLPPVVGDPAREEQGVAGPAPHASNSGTLPLKQSAVRGPRRRVDVPIEALAVTVLEQNRASWDRRGSANTPRLARAATSVRSSLSPHAITPSAA